jgi:eukaryotic-like serine/threonine-protein kinase
LHDIGEEGGEIYLAKELASGGTMRTWLAAQPRSWREIVRVFLGAGRALAAAHAVGLIHRDFEPENVLVGGDGTPRVTDFGWCARDEVGAPPVGWPPETVTRPGTPAYMAPEQLQARAVDARADQFRFCGRSGSRGDGCSARSCVASRSIPRRAGARWTSSWPA